MQGFLTI